MILCANVLGPGIRCLLPVKHDGECSPEPRICRAPLQPGVIWIESNPSVDRAVMHALKKQDYVTALLSDSAPKEDR